MANDKQNKGFYTIWARQRDHGNKFEILENHIPRDNSLYMKQGLLLTAILTYMDCLKQNT